MAAERTDIIGFSFPDGKCGETKSFIGRHRRSGWRSPVAERSDFRGTEPRELLDQGLCVKNNIGSMLAVQNTIEVDVLIGPLDVIAPLLNGESEG